jgi:spermidine synthase
VASFGVFIFTGERLNEGLVAKRWEALASGYELVAESESKYQNLAVARLAGQHTLFTDGQATTDFPDPYTFVPLAHLWMCQHPSPAKVLVLGGGAEGLLTPILEHPVERVDYVEPDPRQIDIIAPFLPEADRKALNDGRVKVHYQDARFLIKSVRDRFDLIIARLPEPTSASKARFFTREFFGELRRAMTSRSVLCMTAASTPGELTPVSGEYLASIAATIKTHFPSVVVGWGDPAYIFAATEAGLVTTDPLVLGRRYSDREIQSERFDPVWFEGATDWLESEKLARRANELAGIEDVQVSTDLHPIVYLQRLVLWDRMTGGRAPSFIEHLRSLDWRVLSLFIVLVAGAILVGTRALFMAGLVIGSAWMGRRTGRDTRSLWTRLIAIDIALAILATAVPLLLPALGRTQIWSFILVEWVISVLVVSTGILGGAAFAVTGGLQLAAVGRAGRAAGVVVAADHAGACAGALLTGILLVPVYGTVTTALLLSALKLVSASGLAIAAMHLRARKGDRIQEFKG